MGDAAEAVENEMQQVEGPGDISDNSASLFLVLGLLGVSVSIEGLSAYHHYNRATVGLVHSDIVTPGIYLLLSVAGGFSYLFYSSVYNEVGNTADTVSIMMRMSPVVYALYFLAVAIPAIEVYLHPSPEPL